jgi:ParB family transcriptional regulator, chromosome partitioning protein
MGRRDLYNSLDTSADGIGAEKMKAQIAELQKSGAPDKIDPNLLVRSRYQPRTSFPPDEMAELTESILSVGGVLVPVIARPGSNELIAGERRTLAAIELGLDSIPVHWHECTDIEAAEFAAFENVKRADLNAIDETNMVLNMIVLRLELIDRQAAIDLVQKIYAQKNSRKADDSHNIDIMQNISLVEDTIKHFTKGSISIGSFCSNKLKLLNFPKEIVEAIQSDQLEYTKASEIAKITDEAERTELLDRVVEEGLSVKQVKEAVAKVQPPKPKKQQPTPVAEKDEDADFEQQEPSGLEIDESDEYDANDDYVPDRPKEPVGSFTNGDDFADSDEAIDIEISEAVTKIRFVFDNDSISPETKIKVMELLSQVVDLII